MDTWHSNNSVPDLITAEIISRSSSARSVMVTKNPVLIMLDLIWWCNIVRWYRLRRVVSALMFDWDTMIGVDEVKQVWNYYQPSSGREELCWELSLSSNNNMMEEYCFVFKYFPTLHLLTQDHMVCTLVHQTFTTTSLHLERPWLGRAFE